MRILYNVNFKIETVVFDNKDDVEFSRFTINKDIGFNDKIDEYIGYIMECVFHKSEKIKKEKCIYKIHYFHELNKNLEELDFENKVIDICNENIYIYVHMN